MTLSITCLIWGGIHTALSMRGPSPTTDGDAWRMLVIAAPAQIAFVYGIVGIVGWAVS